MSEVTVSLIKAKMEHWTGTERLFLAAKDPQLTPTCGPPFLVLDDVPISRGEKKLLPLPPPPRDCLLEMTQLPMAWVFFFNTKFTFYLG